MVSVIDCIIEIEKKNHLYEMIDERGIPVWDVLRYDVIKAIVYKYNPNRELLPKSSFKHKIIILLKATLDVIRLLPLGRRRVFFYAHSRDKDSDGLLYDRIAGDLISRVKPKQRVVFDALVDGVVCYKTFSLPIGFFYATSKKVALEKQIGQKIVDVINKGFMDSAITYDTLQNIYNQFVAQVRMFDWLLKRTKPEKIIISYGRFKPLCFSARKASIPSYLMQHSLIEKDDATIAGTCPNKKYGINADVLLTFGSYWGDYLKHLMDVQVIGNRIMSKVGVVPQYDGSIVIASSLYQGPYISSFFVDFAGNHPEKSFVYKLHPGEAAYLNRYQDLFARCPNVKVILNEKTMDELIKTCSLMVLVSSTTFYEALHLKKCAAIYNIQEFESITRFLLKVPNSYSFTTEEELESIIENAKFDDSLSISFFEPFKDDVASKIIS